MFRRFNLARKEPPNSLRLVMTAVNAALYAALGFVTAGLPTAFGVRFWPQVFVPATFSVLFGPLTGGVGAAIGIFLGDVIYGHHDALLSLLVGVPSNFIGFFIIGWLTNRTKTSGRSILFVLSLLFPVALAAYGVYLLAAPSGFGSNQFLIALVGIVAVILIVGFTVLKNKWAEYEIASSIGLGVGSLIIGFGLVAYSFMFTLPAVLGFKSGILPTTVAYSATAFTYLSEIPFLVALTPPIIAACRAAFPSLSVFKERHD
jgi:uncharacterized membrane protein